MYTLHYFQYLWGLSPRVGLELVRDWILVNPLSRRPGWDPYPISLRVREWLEWLHENPDLPPGDRDRIVSSVAEQLTVLAARREFHLLGNHLLENAITLCWAGLSLRHPQADAWLRSGWPLLSQLLEEQVLGDGTHDERSPMYQGLVAEALLRLAGVAADSPHDAAEGIGEASLSAGRSLVQSLRRLTHPDGLIALVNDSAFGIGPRLRDLRHRFELTDAGTTPAGRWALADAGYAGTVHDGSYLVFDAGPLGPDHQPGHGHADCLSFELSHRGRRLATDTGVYTYSPGAMRAGDRGTACHNTGQIDGLDQAELWGAFRCGRRPFDISLATCWHDERRCRVEGRLRFLSGRGTALQQRAISIGAEGLQFEDEVQLRGAHSVTFRLHLAPGLSLKRTEAGWSIREQKSTLAELVCPGVTWTEARSPYHPEFGLEVERACLEAKAEFLNRFAFRWSLRLV